MAIFEATKSKLTDNMNGQSKEETNNKDVKDMPAKSQTPKKRKEPPTAAREATRKSARGASRPKPSQAQLLKYMLSKDAEDLCRPEDERKDLASRKDVESTITYTSSAFTPFQELVSAVILCRPISHTLGLRAIRTLFNAPYEFTTAKKMSEAGSEKLHDALKAARTQHKAKTADQLYFLADVVLEKYTSSGDKQGEQLGKLLSEEDVDAALDGLEKHIKGFGATGKGIFRRRVQWLFTAAYPFVDSKSTKALQELGLPDQPDEMVQAIDACWADIEHERIAGQNDDEKKRRALVVVLERATGANLEGKVGDILQKASDGEK